MSISVQCTLPTEVIWAKGTTAHRQQGKQSTAQPYQTSGEWQLATKICGKLATFASLPFSKGASQGQALILLHTLTQSLANPGSAVWWCVCGQASGQASVVPVKGGQGMASPARLNQPVLPAYKALNLKLASSRYKAHFFIQLYSCCIQYQ